MEKSTATTYPDLKSWRDDHKFDQAQAAAFIGISQSHYSRIERRAAVPRGDLANLIIDKTGVSLKALLGAA